MSSPQHEPSAQSLAQKYQLPYKKMALAGGSTRGFAYVGVFEELIRLGITQEIDYIHGTSAGSIVALIIATGWGFEKICQTYEKIDTKKFTYSPSEDDGSPEFDLNIIDDYTPSAMSKLINMFMNLGMHNGNTYTQYFRNVLQERTQCPDCKGGQNQSKCRIKAEGEDGKLHCLMGKGLPHCTFAQWRMIKAAYPELGLKDLGVNASEMNLHFGAHDTEFTSRQKKPEQEEDLEFLNTCIADAVRASMAMQLFFKPKIINNRMFGDGGILNNFGMNLIKDDPNKEDPACIGIYLATEQEIRFIENKSNICKHDISDIETAQPKSLSCMVKSTATGLSSAQRQTHIDNPYYVKRTIHVDSLDIGMLDMTLTLKQKNALRYSGKYAVMRWLAMQHEDMAIEQYGKNFVDNLKKQNYPPSIAQFLKNVTVSIPDLSTQKAQDTTTDELLKNWQPMEGMWSVIDDPHKIDPPAKDDPYVQQLPMASRRYTPLLDKTDIALKDAIINFTKNLLNEKYDKPNPHALHDPVYFWLNGRLYDRALLSQAFLKSLPEKYPNALKIFERFLVSIYTNDKTISEHISEDTSWVPTCNMM